MEVFGFHSLDTCVMLRYKLVTNRIRCFKNVCVVGREFA